MKAEESTERGKWHRYRIVSYVSHNFQLTMRETRIDVWLVEGEMFEVLAGEKQI